MRCETDMSAGGGPADRAWLWGLPRIASNVASSSGSKSGLKGFIVVKVLRLGEGFESRGIFVGCVVVFHISIFSIFLMSPS